MRGCPAWLEPRARAKAGAAEGLPSPCAWHCSELRGDTETDEGQGRKQQETISLPDRGMLAAVLNRGWGAQGRGLAASCRGHLAGHLPSVTFQFSHKDLGPVSFYCRGSTFLSNKIGGNQYVKKQAGGGQGGLGPAPSQPPTSPINSPVQICSFHKPFWGAECVPSIASECGIVERRRPVHQEFTIPGETMAVPLNRWLHANSSRAAQLESGLKF